MSNRRAGWIAVVVAVAALLAGCTPSSVPSKFDGSVTQLTTLLESAGVEVVEPDAATADVFRAHVVVLTPSQLESMAAQLRAGSGYPGTTIDDLAGITGDDPGIPPMSYLLAGWVRDGTQPGAIAARALMGKQNWLVPEAIIWPEAVLSLLIADITSDVPAEQRKSPVALGPVDGGGGGLGRAVAAVAGPLPALPSIDIGALCTAGANFVQNALATIFSAIDALAERAEKGIGGIFGTIVGYGIRIVGQVVGKAVDAVKVVIDQVLAPVRSALVVIGILQNIASVVRPWSLDVRAAPTLLEQATLPVPAKFTAKAETEDLPDFAPWVRQCAAAIPIKLPNPPGAGSPVVWTFEPAIGTSAHLTSDLTQTLGDDATSELSFEAAARDPKGPEWEPLEVWIDATVTGQHTEIDQLQKFANDLIEGVLSSIPAVVRGYVAQIVATVRAEAVSALTELLTPAARGSYKLPYIMQVPKDHEPLKRPLTSTSGGSLEFCAAMTDYANWELSGEAFEGVFEDGWFEKVQGRQDALIAITPAAVRDALVSIALSSTAYNAGDFVAPSGSGRAVVKEWANAHCTPDQAATVTTWLDFAG